MHMRGHFPQLEVCRGNCISVRSGTVRCVDQALSVQMIRKPM